MSKDNDRPGVEDFWLSLGMLTGMLTREDVRFDLARHVHTDARGRAWVRLLHAKLSEILRDAPP